MGQAIRSRRGTLNLDEKQTEEMLSKLKKENYELRNERNELRKERDNLNTQLNAAKDRIKNLDKSSGADEDLLAQLARERRDARNIRKDRNALRAEALQLKGLSNALTKKLMKLAKRVSNFDQEMGQAIRSRRGTLNLDEKQTEEMLSKLKKENYELRNERNELRKERDNLNTQLNAAKDRIKNLDKSSGADEDLLAQLARERRDARNIRKDRNALRAEALQLKGLSNALTKKLMKLAKRVSNFDQEMGQAIRSKKTANDMIDELATQLTSMIERYEKAVEEIKKLKKELREQAKRHENELQNKKDKISELKKKK
eukprot:94077_1